MGKIMRWEKINKDEYDITIFSDKGKGVAHINVILPKDKDTIPDILVCVEMSFPHHQKTEDGAKEEALWTATELFRSLVGHLEAFHKGNTKNNK